MYRNSYNRILTKSVKTLTVWCDRGNLDKAEAAKADVVGAIDALLDFTADRVKIKEEREAAKRKLRAAKKGEAKSVSVSEPVAEPEKKTRKTTKATRKAKSGD